MIKQKTVATALVAQGGWVSLGCASLAQQSEPPAASARSPGDGTFARPASALQTSSSLCKQAKRE